MAAISSSITCNSSTPARTVVLALRTATNRAARAAGGNGAALCIAQTAAPAHNCVSRGATLYVNPTNAFGEEVTPRMPGEYELRTLYSMGPYRSAADEGKL